MDYSKGIDVSVNNGVINWPAVRSSGVSFAVVKATQGRGVSAATRNLYLFTDSRFAINIIDAVKAGIRCGAYHYLTAKTVSDAKAEADYFVKVITPYRDRLTIGAYVDVEQDDMLPDSPKQLTEVVDAFCHAVENAGYNAGIYTNPNYLTYKLGDVSMWPLWLAYWAKTLPDKYKYPNLRLWQHGGGSVGGVSGTCDLNYDVSGCTTVPAAATSGNLTENQRWSEIQRKCGFEEATMSYLRAYKYADALSLKIYEQLK